MLIKTIVEKEAAEFDRCVNMALKDGYRISDIKAEGEQLIAFLRYDGEPKPIESKFGTWIKRECSTEIDEKGYHFECSECGLFHSYTANYCEACGSRNFVVEKGD